jgi:hypothetical protein
VTAEAARRPATSVFPTEANRSEAPLLGVERGIGTPLRLGQGRVETSLLSRFPPPNPPIGPIKAPTGVFPAYLSPMRDRLPSDHRFNTADQCFSA